MTMLHSTSDNSAHKKTSKKHFVRSMKVKFTEIISTENTNTCKQQLLRLEKSVVSRDNFGSDALPKVPSILADIYWAGSLLPEILMILFTQSTAVLHKYLNDELKYFVCYNFSLWLHRIPSFPCSEKSLSIPGLWPPWPCVASESVS